MLNSHKAQFVFIGILFSCFAVESFSNIEQVFTEIYHTNFWKDSEAHSGQGSNLLQTKILRTLLSEMFKQFGIKTIVDAPCGDFNWMKEVNLANISYLGIDIVEPLIRTNQKRYAQENVIFDYGNIITYHMSQVDLIMCRDCLVHLTFDEAWQAIKNFTRSGAKYLLVTTYPDRKSNRNIENGWKWRPLNMTIAPFNFPKPVLIINEKYTGGNSFTPDKSLGLWRLDDIKCVN